MSLSHGADIVKFLMSNCGGGVGTSVLSENNTCSIMGLCEFEPWSATYMLSLRLLIQIGRLSVTKV